VSPLVIAFPSIDPIAFELGPIVIRWYALAYIVGIVAGWRLALRLVERPPIFMDRVAIDDLVAWVTLGVILGGRLGYVLFYKPGHYLTNPLDALMLWHGGMSFHGGMIGVIVATIVFAHRRRIPALALLDIVALLAPIGLLLGRLANFINAELYGRASDVAWAMVFPTDRLQLPRHPSQLYEAFLEGLVLFAVLAWMAWRSGARARPGIIGGTFLIGYAIGRIIAEFFREPDAHLGFLFGGATMGQLLSLPMLVTGIAVVAYALSRPALAETRPT
jgi:phosphatidylglycerol:prolipoprotein diacylglycerol transferase